MKQDFLHKTQTRLSTSKDFIRTSIVTKSPEPNNRDIQGLEGWPID